MHAARLMSCLLIVLAAAGCDQFPDVKAATTDAARTAPRPTLVDSRPVLAEAEAIELDEEAQAAIIATAEDLQARAAADTSPVITEAERERLLDTHARLRARAEQEQGTGPDGATAQ